MWESEIAVIVLSFTLIWDSPYSAEIPLFCSLSLSMRAATEARRRLSLAQQIDHAQGYFPIELVWLVAIWVPCIVPKWIPARHKCKQRKYTFDKFLAAEDDRPSYTSPGERLHFPPPSTTSTSEEYSDHYYHSHRAAVDLLAALNVTLAGEFAFDGLMRSFSQKIWLVPSVRICVKW